MNERTWWSKVVLIGGILGAVLLPVGALGSRFGIWPFGTGFAFLAAGVLCAVACLVLGVVGLIVAMKRNRGADKPGLFIGTGVSVLVLGLMFVQFNTATNVPPIHNISTDTADPPRFDAIVAIRDAQTNPPANPLTFTDAIRDAQVPAYPGVQTLVSDMSAQASFDRAVEVVADMGWELVASDAAAGIVEATAVTFWFGFKDDVVVRIRPSGAGSKIDLHSVSRVGGSDLGANARRIMQFLERFDA